MTTSTNAPTARPTTEGREPASLAECEAMIQELHAARREFIANNDAMLAEARHAIKPDQVAALRSDRQDYLGTFDGELSRLTQSRATFIAAAPDEAARPSPEKIEAIRAKITELRAKVSGWDDAERQAETANRALTARQEEIQATIGKLHQEHDRLHWKRQDVQKAYNEKIVGRHAGTLELAKLEDRLEKLLTTGKAPRKPATAAT